MDSLVIHPPTFNKRPYFFRKKSMSVRVLNDRVKVEPPYRLVYGRFPTIYHVLKIQTNTKGKMNTVLTLPL